MNLIKQKNLVLAFTILFVSSCQTSQNEIKEPEVNKIIISEDKIFEEYLASQWDKDLEDRPIFASLLGDKRFNQDITPNDLEYYQNRIVKLQDKKEKLKSFDFNKLNSDNKLNYKLLDLNLDNSLEASNYPSYYMSLNQRGGVQSYYETGDRLVYSSKSDYEDWLVRLSKYSDNIINLKIFLSANDEYFINDDKNQLIEDAKELITNKIIPAYQELNTFLKDEYLPQSRDSIGLDGVPNGKEWYEYVARYHTTTNLTPDEIHDIGLNEVKRIRSEMEQIIKDLEWEGDFKSFLNYLRTSPRFYYDNGEDLLNAYLIMAKKIDPLLPKIFKVFPRAPYGVIPIPEESAPFTTTAYYNGPAKGRPGYFYANLYKPESRPKYEIPVLTVHEAVPGHHFQISLAQELENVPTFRKYLSFTAFVEGWGLYSEELGEFMGIYDDPYDKFGQLTYDMWRAIRLVVDTGMHYKGWSRDDAINLFIENTAKSKLDIENEVDRYIAWPGQALAYKIGQLKILELRQKAERELGDKYDIKDFHHEILKRGSVPLDILEGYINDWISETLDS
ncbi:MAG: DUF885 domain-containing protein [Proteobacteria bacterium]|nr:DUF885 domain-containing protein [Pseudomonadota bacterium]